MLMKDELLMKLIKFLCDKKIIKIKNYFLYNLLYVL